MTNSKKKKRKQEQQIVFRILPEILRFWNRFKKWVLAGLLFFITTIIGSLTLSVYTDLFVWDPPLLSPVRISPESFEIKSDGLNHGLPITITNKRDIPIYNVQIAIMIAIEGKLDRDYMDVSLGIQGTDGKKFVPARGKDMRNYKAITYQCDFLKERMSGHMIVLSSLGAHESIRFEVLGTGGIKSNENLKIRAIVDYIGRSSEQIPYVYNDSTQVYKFPWINHANITGHFEAGIWGLE